MQIKIYFYIQWPWDNNATGIVVEYQLIVAAIAPSYVSRSIKGDVHPGISSIYNIQFKNWYHLAIVWKNKLLFVFYQCLIIKNYI